MPWVHTEHKCKKPRYSWRRRPEQSLWKCPDCEIVWRVDRCENTRYGYYSAMWPWYELVLVKEEGGYGA